MDDLINKYFKAGAPVEISSNEDGFRGAWFAGTVVHPLPKKSSSKKARTTKNSRKPEQVQILVEYNTLMANKSGTRPLREVLDVVQLRPPPPREQHHTFVLSEEVDAYHNDGWWEGVITAVLEGERYSVFFRSNREQLEFHKSELRLHREWVNGKWVPPLESEDGEVEKLSQSTDENPSKAEDNFTQGQLVEVSSDEEGFQGAWFTATVVRKIDKDKYLIEYKNLRNDDDTEFLQEEVDNLHIRPCPPEIPVPEKFKVLQEVDALYNDGWWVGVVSKVHRGPRYTIFFRGTNEKTDFKHTDLRIHQDWINGKWVVPSLALKL